MISDSLIFCLADIIFSKNNFKLNDDLSFNDNDLMYLKQLLFENILENITSSRKDNFINLVIYTNQENIFQEIVHKYENDKLSIQFCNDSYKLSEILSNYSKIFIIKTDSIGFSSEDLSNNLNILSSEDNILLISKSLSDEICYIAFNKFDDNVVELTLKNNLSYDEFLSKLDADKFFIQTTNNYFRVNSFSNFKLLYQKLSEKESLSYCSQQMHEKFTNLFIEYRDYIK